MKWLTRAAGLSLTVFAALIVAFVIYGWSQGHAPFRALANLLKSHPPAVDTNPEIPVIAEHRVTWLGDIEARELSESSGLTTSILHEDTLWSINDSGGEAELFAMSTTGRHIAKIEINTETPVDLEALDAFELDNEAYIALADVGDNFGWRSHVEILVVREPDKLIDATVDIAWRIRLTYPEGPRDSEAIAVDAANERILILSKREYPQKLYQSALRESGEAVLISALPGLPQATHADFAEEPDTAQYRHMPSGMDYFPETDALLLTTYKHAYLYRLNALEAGPIMIPMPSVGQREAISWLNENSAVVSRERPQGVGVADLFKIEILTY